MSSIRIAIVGSRDFEDYELVSQEVSTYICNNINAFVHNDKIYVKNGTRDETLIISGGAKGADTLAERFAKDNNFNIKIFKPDWELYGKRAGFIRNSKIVDNCDVLFAFQINNSKGTQHSINLAKEKNKEVFVFNIERDNND